MIITVKRNDLGKEELPLVNCKSIDTKRNISKQVVVTRFATSSDFTILF